MQAERETLGVAAAITEQGTVVGDLASACAIRPGSAIAAMVETASARRFVVFRT
jgi:hypothetical protein